MRHGMRAEGAGWPPADPGRAPGTWRAGRAAAVILGAVILVLFVATMLLGRSAHLGGAAGAGLVVVAIASLVVGVLLATRRPDNPMGWCLLGGALFLSLSGVGGSVSVLDYRMHHTIPFGGVAVVLQPSWAPAIVFFGLSFLLFPSGHFSSRAVRWTTWLVLAVGAVWMTGAYGIAIQAVVSHTVRLDRTANLLAIDHPHGSWAWWGVVQGVFFVVVAFSWILWLVLQVPRYRRAGNEERHQMKWLLSGATISLASGFVGLGSGLLGLGASSGLASGIGVTCLAALPVSIAIGATKFHLYAIDRLISRTVAYVLLTGVVVGVYVGVVSLSTKVVGVSSPVGVAASTLVAVALFNPVRRRVQRAVDRRFNRARYDAERTVAAFASRLRESVDASFVRTDLMRVVSAVFEPDSAAVWIRGEAGSSES